jgi:hypothetical protein
MLILHAGDDETKELSDAEPDQHQSDHLAA